MATREVGKKYLFAYSDCKYDIDGWVDANHFKPLAFDIMYLKVVRDGNELKKSIPGWWTGSAWAGQRIKDPDKVLFWKRKPEAVT